MNNSVWRDCRRMDLGEHPAETFFNPTAVTKLDKYRIKRTLYTNRKSNGVCKSRSLKVLAARAFLKEYHPEEMVAKQKAEEAGCLNMLFGHPTYVLAILPALFHTLWANLRVISKIRPTDKLTETFMENLIVALLKRVDMFEIVVLQNLFFERASKLFLKLLERQLVIHTAKISRFHELISNYICEIQFVNARGCRVTWSMYTQQQCFGAIRNGAFFILLDQLVSWKNKSLDIIKIGNDFIIRNKYYIQSIKFQFRASEQDIKQLLRDTSFKYDNLTGNYNNQENMPTDLITPGYNQIFPLPWHLFGTYEKQAGNLTIQTGYHYRITPQWEIPMFNIRNGRNSSSYYYEETTNLPIPEYPYGHHETN
jgi:hypothetical protein